MRKPVGGGDLLFYLYLLCQHGFLNIQRNDFLKSIVEILIQGSMSQIFYLDPL